MKKHEVKVGTTYRVKVSGSVQDVRITGENPHGGWDGVNTVTNRSVRVKSAQRLRAVAGQRPAKRPAGASLPGRKKIMSLAEYEAEAKGEQQPKDGAAATTKGKPADGGVTSPAKKREPKGPRHSLANAAILVLAEAKEPMNAKAIVEKATADGLYTPGDGKTPDATLYSSMLRDKKARFHKAERGVWALTDAGKAEVDAIRHAFAAK